MNSDSPSMTAGPVRLLSRPLPAHAPAVPLPPPGRLLQVFAGAIASYALHGLRRDTTNQFGGKRIPTELRLSMYGLIVGEIGGFLVLFSGFVAGQF